MPSCMPENAQLALEHDDKMPLTQMHSHLCDWRQLFESVFQAQSQAPHNKRHMHGQKEAGCTHVTAQTDQALNCFWQAHGNWVKVLER